jgi:hypothetical protein
MTHYIIVNGNAVRHLLVGKCSVINDSGGGAAISNKCPLVAMLHGLWASSLIVSSH